MQLERYREHLKKHADETAAAGPEGDAGAEPSAAEAEPSVPAGGARQNPTGAAGGARQNPSVDTQGGSKMMDVGARAGYYTEKSPKMMLMEWTQQQKRPKPRYVVQKLGEGAFGCKACALGIFTRQCDYIFSKTLWR